MCTKDSMISLFEQPEQNAECCTAINNSTINNNIYRNKRQMQEKTHNATKKEKWYSISLFIHDNLKSFIRHVHVFEKKKTGKITNSNRKSYFFYSKPFSFSVSR